MDAQFLILVINTGSTSTKVAVFLDDTRIHEITLHFDKLNLSSPINPTLYLDQLTEIISFLENRKINLQSIDCIVARGGLLKPLPSGTYKIDQQMCEELIITKKQHACNLSALIAMELSKAIGVPAYIVDPPVVDEMDAIAKVSGLAGVERISRFHALNQKEIARKAARDLGKKYAECNLIVSHMGGGITVGAHKCGLVVDVNNGLDGDGPFSPNRSGGLPICSVLDMVYDTGMSREAINKYIVGMGGLISYLGTMDILEIEKRIDEGDASALLYLQAMAYQVAKEIGSCACVLMGQVDAIVLTGGIANSQRIVNWISERVRFIASILIYPGEDEMKALAAGGIRVLNGTETANDYPPAL